MVALITVIVALATSTLALAIAIASGQIFSGYGWLVPYLVVACIGLYVLALALAIANWIQKRRGKDKPITSSQQPTQSINQEANPQQNVYIGTDLLPRESDRQKESLATPEPKPNIQFVESKTIRAHAGLEDRQIYESPQGLGDFQVSVVCFRNEAVVGKAVQQPHLTAHIIYKNKDGEEIADAPRGVWIGHYGESVHFETGKKRCLIVFLLSKQSTLMKPWNESYRTSRTWMSGRPSFRIQIEGIRGDVASVEVNLLGRDVCFLRAIFDIEPRDRGELPKLVPRSISEG